MADAPRVASPALAVERRDSARVERLITRVAFDNKMLNTVHVLHPCARTFTQPDSASSCRGDGASLTGAAAACKNRSDERWPAATRGVFSPQAPLPWHRARRRETPVERPI